MTKAIEQQFLEASPAYPIQSLQDSYKLRKFRDDLERVKGLSATQFGKLLKDMDFRLLNERDMQEIEVNHFGYEAQDYDVGEYEILHQAKRKEAGKLTWSEYL